jgi:SAM-dependent methyltransferase
LCRLCQVPTLQGYFPDKRSTFLELLAHPTRELVKTKRNTIRGRVIVRHKRSFPEGVTLESELNRVMNALASAGVKYPPGYFRRLIRRYRKSGVRYPRILMRVGEPNIRRHNRYREMLEAKGKFLDYGCGTGDDIRALLKDGYPSQNIVGYDINWDSINLGFDLYLDRDSIGVRFVVGKMIPFRPSTFDVVYSGSVLHVLGSKRTIKRYISNTYAFLNPGGIFFGSTLGFGKIRPTLESERMRRMSWWRRLLWRRRLGSLSQDRLQSLLREKGFMNVEVSQDDTFRRLWFYGKKPS